MIPQALLPVLLLGWASPALAQVALNLTAESDYVFRGISLSDGRPDATLGVDYDGSGGWYAGGSATAVELDSDQHQALLFAYVGYARRTASGLAWEIGATAAHFTADSRYDYGEAFVGVLAQSWSVRISLSPSYFGGAPTLYTELNGTTALGGAWRWFGHVGALALTGGGAATESRRIGFDARLGVSTTIGAAELRLAWVGATRGGFYTASYADRPNALVLSAAYFF